MKSFTDANVKFTNVSIPINVDSKHSLNAKTKQPTFSTPLLSSKKNRAKKFVTANADIVLRAKHLAENDYKSRFTSKFRPSVYAAQSDLLCSTSGCHGQATRFCCRCKRRLCLKCVKGRTMIGGRHGAVCYNCSTKNKRRWIFWVFVAIGVIALIVIVLLLVDAKAAS